MASRKEEREALQAKLAELDAADAEEEQEFDYEIGSGEHYARISSKSPAGKKAKAWFKANLGIDLDEEPVQDDEPEGEPKDKPRPGRSQAKGDNVRAFTTGRRTG